MRIRRKGSLPFPKIGDKFNHLTYVGGFQSNEDEVKNWHQFVCDCGVARKVTLWNVVSGKTKSCGCIRGDAMRKAKGHFVNTSAFSELNEESAYWLGFILADGNLASKSYTITIGLQRSDWGHLEKFREFLKCSRELYYTLDGRKVVFSVGSQQIYKNLLKWWITPKKSLTVKVHPELEMNRHFWRGVIDGDGHIITVGAGINVVGTEDVCEKFLNFAKTFIKTDTVVRKTKETLHSVSISLAEPEKVILFEELYKNHTISLARKQETVDVLIEKVRNELGCKKPILVGGVTYKSVAEATRNLGVCQSTIFKMLRNGEATFIRPRDIESFKNNKYHADNYTPPPPKVRPVSELLISRRVVVDGVEYSSRAVARRTLGMTKTKLENILNGIEHKTNRIEVVIDGVLYRSKTNAAESLGVSKDDIDRRIRTGVFKSVRTNITIGEIVYKSIPDAAKNLGLEESDIRRFIRNGTFDRRRKVKVTKHIGVEA